MSTYRFLQMLYPPIFAAIGGKLRAIKHRKEGVLFGGDDQLFKKCASESKIYAEYGCGESTVWVSNNTKADIFSVDTSEKWVKSVKTRIGRGRTTLTWVDCGPLTDWGIPIDFSRRYHFKDYAEAPWRQSSKPDLVLIDGRFRVLCFLTSYMNAEEGTKIIFDDWQDRPPYHVIQELIAPIENCGRQALFIVPKRSESNMVFAEKLSREFEFFVY